MTLTEIEQLTRKYADAREELGDLIRAMEDKIEQIKRANLPRVRELVNKTAERQANLRAGIEGAPALFEQPRTHVFHGVKVGFQKGKGTIAIPDPERTLARIHDYYPDQLERFIRTKETPDKLALAELAVADLKRLGCTVADTGDEIVIRATDGAVDKIVNALLKEAADLEAAEKN